ncbi:MAG TPA: phospholipase D-like domain-containing protein [Candidatus Saccharibacteria bacterium]|nr:phospholipase D-like domain-containing protein [Candidatus Saccharibacteria bacterium]
MAGVDSVTNSGGAGLEAINFDLVSAADYPGWLEERVGEAQNRVILQAMEIAYDSATQPLFDDLVQIAEDDKVTVRLVADAYSTLFSDALPFVQPNLRKAYQGWRETRKFGAFMMRLQEAGGEATTINRYLFAGRGLLRFHPWANRNHMKGAVVDDWVALGGGVNLSGDAFSNKDFMLVAKDPTLANWFDELTKHETAVRALDLATDFRVPIDETTQLLVDVGSPGQSIIYDTVCATAERDDVVGIKFVSQMRPSGRLEQILAERQDALGADSVRISINDHSQFRHPARLQEFLNAYNPQMIVHKPTDGSFIHAKAIIFTRADGKKMSISGSHNFNERGVQYGTGELAICTTNPDTVDQIETFFDTLPVC